MRQWTRAENRPIYVAQSRLAGNNQRDPSCLMLNCQAMREYLPLMNPHAFKFGALVASHANELGIAYPGVSQMGKLGYHPEETTAYMQANVESGFLRKIADRRRNPVTGVWEPNLYQVNPELVHIRKELRDEALAIRPDVPFKPLIGISSSSSDHNQLENPIPKNQIPLNQNQITTASNHHQVQDDLENRSAKSAKNGHAGGRKNPRSTTLKTWERKPHNTNAEGVPNSARTSAAAVRHSGPKHDSRFDIALPDSGAEQTAHELKTVCGKNPQTGRDNARLWQCRELVAVYGAEAVRWAIDQLQDAIPRGNVNNPFGLAKSWLDKRMHIAERHYVNWREIYYWTLSENWKDPDEREQYRQLLGHRECPPWLHEAFAKPTQVDSVVTRAPQGRSLSVQEYTGPQAGVWREAFKQLETQLPPRFGFLKDAVMVDFDASNDVIVIAVATTEQRTACQQWFQQQLARAVGISYGKPVKVTFTTYDEWNKRLGGTIAATR